MFGAASFGAIGGCWFIQPDGSISVIEDGLVSSNFQGFGGSSYDIYRQDYMDFLLPDDKVSVNLIGHFDISDSATIFGEVKYVTQETDTKLGSNSFWDLILGAPDNPYLPEPFATLAQDTGGISTTIDPLFFDSVRTLSLIHI